ncbi:hypothetical protein MD537_04945 [Flavihumibacter sediminis]|nr:hypothetical protein [Flavihumibacter sediminis]
MNINRNNYETIFLLYADNELTAAEKGCVEDFIKENPDLKAELEMFMQAILPVESSLGFPDKESLFRTTDTDSLVNITNYEDWFVRYADDELTNEEKGATELFVYKHPEYQSDFELMQQTKLVPDMSVKFPDKKSLYRYEKEESRPVVIGMWFRYAVAAAILIAAGIFWLSKNNAVENNLDGTVTIASQQPLNEKKDVDDKQETIIPEEKKASELVAGKEKKKVSAGELKATGNSEKTSVAESVANNDKRRDPEAVITPVIKDNLNAVNVEVVAAKTVPSAGIDKVVRIVPDDRPNVVYASNAAEEDYIFVPTDNLVRKTPLRGILRKAGRYLEQKNPLSTERSKGGVFTASAEQ